MKRLLPEVLHTRVARRLFLLFVLSAFLPLAAIAVVSLAQVRELLLAQADQRLQATAKGIGMVLFDRLLLASDLAETAGAASATNPDPALQRVFLSVTRWDAAGKATVVAGDAPSAAIPSRVRQRIAAGRRALFVQPRGSGYDVFLAVPLAKENEFAVGRLQPLFVWGPADEVPHATDFCVVEEGTRLFLHCYAPGGEGPLRAFGAQPFDVSGTARWQRDGEAHRGRAWAQFMGAAFGAPDWIVVASQPEGLPLARLAEFQRVYVPAVILALVLVTWLTLRQSRHIVEPVARLAQRAREIANGSFDGRLSMERRDEFGELGRAVDTMSERLGRQFASLTALSEIDGLILSTQDTTQVVRTVLKRLGEVAPADLASLTLYDREAADLANTYYMSRRDVGGFMLDRYRLAPGEKARLEEDASGRWAAIAGLEGNMPAHLAHASKAALARAYVQPIIWRATAYGAIVLGYREGNSLEPEEAQRVREMADRVAVALSTALRDEQLYQQTHFDALTGLPNRMLFMDRLEVEIVRSQREERSLGVLFVDLDHFKNVNDSFGLAMGDMVLRETAARIRACIRSSDTLARLGGDEFAVLMANIVDPQEAWLVAETLIAELSRAFDVGEERCFLGASVGIASFPDDGAVASELLKRSDTAMNRAKLEGRSQAMFFEERMNTEVVSRLTLDRDLRGAIERGEMRLHYQPKVDLRTGTVVGAEALVRWFHPQRGVISPMRFIPLAEASGFIERLGDWIVAEACAQVRAWRDQGLEPAHVAVNISPRQFRRRTLVDSIAASVREARIPASSIEIEITEGLLIERGEAVDSMLRQLAGAGHGIALDDFGTGFSSMAYLKRLPVNTIKIDRIFVDGLEDSDDSKAIVAAIIAMSHALGKIVVAEGVENEAQAAVLRAQGCDQIQGYLISPAVAADEFARIATVRSRETA
jgi:diguanylate cyclase (GGDEF)-like protein